jgi:multimeric flavodoxin WrbA
MKATMKIVAICGSPRKGNSEWMLGKLCEELSRHDVKVEMLLLRKMDVKMCCGCLACEKGGKERKGDCVIKDDMVTVYPKLIAADAIILATPGYMGMLSGLLKNFLDRTCAIWPRLEGKGLAGLAVAEEGIGQTLQNLKGYGKLLKMRWMGSVSVLAKKPHDASELSGLPERLHRLARQIIDNLR